jgi:hypothetical protein
MRTPIEVGSRFQTICDTAFGPRRRSVWRVQTFSERIDGLLHFVLTEERDPTNRKTLSAAALGDQRAFFRVQDDNR